MERNDESYNSMNFEQPGRIEESGGMERNDKSYNSLNAFHKAGQATSFYKVNRRQTWMMQPRQKVKTEGPPCGQGAGHREDMAERKKAKRARQLQKQHQRRTEARATWRAKGSAQ